ncbi:hypothetical protein ABEB36_015382 [Hypothenemus hampei]|uniref:Coiled-coil domain-containing protein 61 n=1 Tax=Hypothenemus hampei TaxID=57062 RepID=A0ABD1E024_HYPHA
MGDPNLVTTCSFHNQEYLFKMGVLNGNLEILITDKNSGEDWQCSYDATYIENLTQKTGNFKQFDIFVAMIKSGLLHTSECVSLDLLAFEDLELLRSRKVTKSFNPANSNRRYLILTYVVEFDKIRYPLPLEYCGPPDPVILQATIRRLESELARTKEKLASKNNDSETRKIYFLQKRIDQLSDENAQLQEEVRQLNHYLERKKPKKQVVHLQKAIKNLERSVVMERTSHHDLVEKLRQDNAFLVRQLEKMKQTERDLKIQLNKTLNQSNFSFEKGDCKRPPESKLSQQSVKVMYRRPATPLSREVGLIHSGELKRNSSKSGNIWVRSREESTRRTLSRTSSINSTNKNLQHDSDYISASRPDSPRLTPRVNRTRSLLHTRCSSGNSSRTSSQGSSSRRKSRSLRRHGEYKKLEEKIEVLQKMLQNNLKSNI